MKKTSINDAIKQLKTSRATLYKYIKKLNIETVKKGNKTFLSEEQIKLIDRNLSINVSSSSKENKAVYTLKKQLEEKNKEIESLTKQNNKTTHEKELSREKYRALEIANAKTEGRAETLENQNNKLHLTSGGLAEQVKNLVIENQKLIEITEQPKKRGAFKQFFKFWAK